MPLTSRGPVAVVVIAGRTVVVGAVVVGATVVVTGTVVVAGAVGAGPRDRVSSSEHATRTTRTTIRRRNCRRMRAILARRRHAGVAVV